MHAPDIGSGNGTFRPVLKFNAKSGRWSYRNIDGDQEINPTSVIVDLANISPCWASFREGQAPNRIYDPSSGTRAPKPSDEHKRGFTLIVAVPKDAVGEDNVCEMSSTSMLLANSIKEVWAQFREGVDANPGKVPVVTIKGVTADKGKFGTNYRPDLTVSSWVERPAGMPDEPASGESPTGMVGNGSGAVHQAAPPATTSSATEF